MSGNVRCWRLNSEKKNKILESACPIFLELPNLGLGMWEEETPAHICPLPDWAPLSTATFAPPHSVSPVTQSPFHWSVFWFTPPCLFASFSPYSLCLFTCQTALFRFLSPSLHGDTLPHVSHCVLNAMMFFFSHSFIREQKLFNISLSKTLFAVVFGGEVRNFVLLHSLLTSSSCFDLFFSNIPCECKYFLSLNLTSHVWEAVYLWLTAWALESVTLPSPQTTTSYPGSAKILRVSLKMKATVKQKKKNWEQLIFFLWMILPASSCSRQKLKFWIFQFQELGKIN